MLPELSTTYDVKTEKPVAVTLSKSDLLKTLFMDTSTLHGISSLFTPSKHVDYLDLSAIDTIDYEVSKLLKKSYIQFVTIIQAYLSNYKCFAVSSIGLDATIQTNDQHLYMLSHRPNPLRVEEPLLWILYQLGLVIGSTPKLQQQSFLSRLFS